MTLPAPEYPAPSPVLRRGLASLLILGGLSSLACPRVVLPDFAEEAVCTTSWRTEVARVGARNKVDVILVVDADGRGMLRALESAPERLGQLFGTLLDTANPPDFHLAVLPTNTRGIFVKAPEDNRSALQACFRGDGGVPGERDGGGAGRVEDGGVFVPDDVGCDTCGRYLSRSQCRCEALELAFPNAGVKPCSNLVDAARQMFAAVQPTPDLARSSMGVAESLYVALGLVPACGESGFRVDPPPANAGFYREDATLLVVALTGSSDPLVPQGVGVGAYLNLVRQLRSLKGPGREEDVRFAVITGICRGDSCSCRGTPGCVEQPWMDVSPEAFCAGLNADVVAAAPACGPVSVAQLPAAEALLAGTALAGCDLCILPNGTRDPRCGPLERAHAAPALQLMGVACDTGGAVYNLCAPSWDSVITEDIRRVLSPGDVFVRFSEPPADDPEVEVHVLTNAGVELTIPSTDYQVEADGVRVFSTTPDTEIIVSYEIAGDAPRCCPDGCNDDEFCNGDGSEESFCQVARCGQGLGCPEGSGSCDVAKGLCVPLHRCTRDEHCPAGFLCDCASNTCTFDPARSCR